jgi:hypothetical protein
VLVLACGDGGGPGTPARTFLMGFSPIPPKPELDLLLAGVDSFRRRSDAAILHQSVPWAALLAGIPADSAVRSNELGLANLFRAYGLRVVIMVDPTDGLARDREAPELIAAGRSVTEPAIQALYRAYVRSVATLVRPEYLGLVAETNLIRAAAPDSVYDALVAMANAAAAELGTVGVTSALYVSVQVSGGATGRRTYAGVATDLTDFPATPGASSTLYRRLRSLRVRRAITTRGGDGGGVAGAGGRGRRPSTSVGAGRRRCDAGTLHRAPDRAARRGRGDGVFHHLRRSPPVDLPRGRSCPVRDAGLVTRRLRNLRWRWTAFARPRRASGAHTSEPPPDRRPRRHDGREAARRRCGRRRRGWADRADREP